MDFRIILVLAMLLSGCGKSYKVDGEIRHRVILLDKSDIEALCEHKATRQDREDCIDEWLEIYKKMLGKVGKE